MNTNATPIRHHKGIGYACCYCDAEFPEAADLKSHTLDNHKDVSKASFLKNITLNRYHVKLDITDLKCTICGIAIENLQTLMDHLLNEHDKMIYTDVKNRILPFKFDTGQLRCFMCNNMFHKFKMLQEHMGIHYRNYVCDVCDIGFVTLSGLTCHKLSHKTGRYPCKECGLVLDTIVKKRNHEKRHSEKHKCMYCEETFKGYRSKEHHLITVHNLKVAEPKCQACGKVYANRKLLNVHIKQVHLMERPHKCKECEMQFFSSHEMKRHMVKHTKVRQFKCTVCLKAFGRDRTLKEHLRIHNNDRRFKCHHCGQAFVQKCSLKTHLKSKHGEYV